LPVEPEHTGAKVHGNQKRQTDHQHIDQYPGPADLADLLEGNAKAIEDDAGAQ
jgi:hypothetical protein